MQENSQQNYNTEEIDVSLWKYYSILIINLAYSNSELKYFTLWYNIGQIAWEVEFSDLASVYDKIEDLYPKYVSDICRDLCHRISGIVNGFKTCLGSGKGLTLG